ncbi:MAG: N-acetyl-gamma-glutamyl-phosphate reductase [Planctomycetes bacterium]|nr:N-acetyl-gamma-glutamyl-phosphate reductase [Planctomycetota bacterium]
MISKTKQDSIPTMPQVIAPAPPAPPDSAPGMSRAPTRLCSSDPQERAGSIPEQIRTAVFGGSGYVAGELLRLLVQHPKFAPAAIASTSQVGERVPAAFPHLAGTRLDGCSFVSERDALAAIARPGATAVFLATPHGAAAPLAKQLLAARAAAGLGDRDDGFHIVDLSADFRFADATEWSSIYGKPHAAPELLARFTCAVPEHAERIATPHAAQPGCFTTAVTCAAWPFFRLGLVEGDVFVSAVTGSSGSGKTPAANTHHPERHSTLYAYNALAHRHEPEMRHLIGAACRGCEPDVEFVPHSGPFVRGIHATLRMSLREPMAAVDLVERVNALYSERARKAGGASFVVASTAPPKLTEVVGTNRVGLGIATRGRTLIVTSVIDNLTKGAAGGAVQWMNRLFGLPDATGLELPGWGWY